MTERFIGFGKTKEVREKVPSQKYLCVKHNAISVSGKSNDCKYSIVKYHEEKRDTQRSSSSMYLALI